MVRNPREIAADAEAWAVCYAESCGAYAAAKARSDLAEQDDRLYRAAMDAKVAMDNVLARLLDACNELCSAGFGVVAANLYRSADQNATLASALAFKAELSGLRGAA